MPARRHLKRPASAHDVPLAATHEAPRGIGLVELHALDLRAGRPDPVLERLVVQADRGSERVQH